MKKNETSPNSSKITPSSIKISNSTDKGKKLSLILAGGGIKAASYLGFIKALEENDIEIDKIGGYSGGALVGVSYAMGIEFDEIQKILSKLSLWKLIDLSMFTKKSLISDKQLNKQLDEMYGDVKFSDLNKKIVIFCTNLTKKRLEWFDKGYVKKYIRASMALSPLIPSIFMNKDEYIDAAFMTAFPTKEMREIDKDNVIVGLIPRKNFKMLPDYVVNRANYLGLLFEQGLKLMIENDPPDMIIETLEKDEGHILSFKLADKYYAQGYEIGKKSIIKIKKLLDD